MLFLVNERIEKLLEDYNHDERCERCNRVADSVYKAREKIGDPLSTAFESDILHGLKGFEMARTMRDGFSQRLHSRLESLRGKNVMTAFTGQRLSSIDLNE